MAGMGKDLIEGKGNGKVENRWSVVLHALPHRMSSIANQQCQRTAASL